MIRKVDYFNAASACLDDRAEVASVLEGAVAVCGRRRFVPQLTQISSKRIERRHLVITRLLS
jgi:hypothetical protein